MLCELFFSYESDIDIEVIVNHLITIPNPKQIITDNLILHEFLQKNGYNSKMISELIPDDGPLAEEIYAKSKNLHNKYKNAFRDLEYNGVSIFSGFDLPLFLQLTILFKAEKVLNEKINTIFIFREFFDIFFVIKKLAKEMGYSSSMEIGLIESKKINFFSYNSDGRVEDYRERFSKKRTYTFLKNSFGIKPSINNTKIIFMSLIQMITILSKRASYRLFSIFNIKPKESLIKKIYQTLKSNESTKIAFFVTTSRADLYLKPWYSVFELLKKSSTSYKIFTSDLATSIVLSKEKIKFINLFNYIYPLEKEIKKSDIWNEINLEVKKIINQNNSIFGINELLKYVMDQIRRTLALILILEVIERTSNLKSIIAVADGEMLENIAVSYAKKICVSSFSLLPGYVSPQPILSEWFKVNKIFVHGLDGFEALLKLGYDKNRLQISGNPKYDFLKTLKLYNAKKILEDQIGIDSKKPLIVIAMSRWHDNDELWMSNFIKYCNNNNFEIIIKIHPVYKSAARKQSEAKLDKISKNCKNMKYVISYDIDMPILLSAAELIITDFSNVGIEAILLDRPLLTVNLSNESFEYVLRYHEYGSSLYIEKYQDLEKITKEIIIEKKYLGELSNGRKKIIELINYKNDGKAGERIFNSLNH